jgi:hypothetical protein
MKVSKKFMEEEMREPAHKDWKKEKSKKSYPKGKKSKGKIEKVMHEFKEGELHSGSKKGPKVTNKAQGIAIALSEARKIKSKYKGTK